MYAWDFITSRNMLTVYSRGSLIIIAKGNIVNYQEGIAAAERAGHSFQSIFR